MTYEEMREKVGAASDKFYAAYDRNEGKNNEVTAFIANAEKDPAFSMLNDIRYDFVKAYDRKGFYDSIPVYREKGMRGLEEKLQEYCYIVECLDYIAGADSVSPKAKEHWDKFMEANAKVDPQTGAKIYPLGLESKDLEAEKELKWTPVQELKERKEREEQEKKAREEQERKARQEQEQEKKEREERERKEREEQERLAREAQELQKDEELWRNIEHMPGDMRLALQYPGVDPTGKTTKEDYKAYVDGTREKIERQLFGNQKRPERVDIIFENLDHIMTNMKVAAIMSKDSTISKDNELYRKIHSVVNMEAAEKTLEKYFPATLEPFMEAAYGEFDKASHNGIKREKLLLVNGMSVKMHLTKAGQIPKNREEYNRLVSNFVGIALQNGYKVEAYVPDKDGKVPAKRIELHAAGSKISEMKLLPERAWEKFCNFFGVETDRQKYNKQVMDYYGNLERSKRDLKRHLGEQLTGYEEEDRKDLEAWGAEKNVTEESERIVNQMMEIAGTRENVPLYEEKRTEYLKLTTSILQKKDRFGEDYWRRLTTKEAEFDDHLSTFLAAMDAENNDGEILYDVIPQNKKSIEVISLEKMEEINMEGMEMEK